MTLQLRFDELELVAKIQRLSGVSRAAFAVACAARLRDAYARFSSLTSEGDLGALDKITSRLWDDLAGDSLSDSEIDELIEVCMTLIPQEGDGTWVNEQAAAEDGASALAYALRCRRNGLAKEAGWAARRAYEALDHYVINVENIDTNTDGAESRVLAHPLVQAELLRQQRDLEALLRGEIGVRQLQERSKMEAEEFIP